MRKICLAGLLTILAVLGFANHVTGLLGGILLSIEQVAEAVDATPLTHITYKKDDMQHTGCLTKIINGTEVKLDYVWDGTADDWRRIMGLWKVICDNPPG